MTPTSLPSVNIAPAPAATPVATEIAPADFLLMLGQMLGTPVPAAAGAAVPTATPAVSKERSEDLLSTDVAAVDFLAMFPLSLPVTLPSQQLPAGAGAEGSGAFDIDGIVSGRSSGAAATDLQLLSDLLRDDHTLAAESTSDFGSVQLAPVSETQQPTRAAATPDVAALSRPIHQPVGSAAWADEIGSRLALMTEHGKHTASLRLSPEHLGPLEIRISINDDQASVWFGAAHADTRAAIETALPRLRELFASTGMSLTDAGVFHEPPRQHPAPSAHSGSANGDGSLSEESPATVVRTSILGLVDAYA